MNPLQEYYLRNNVRTPYVFFGSGQAILSNPRRLKPCEKYKLLDIHAINKEGSDGVNIGKFHLVLSVPQKSTSVFIKDSDWVVYWDEYESHIIEKASDWVRSDWRILSSPDELKMASWELLSYSQDSRFANLPIPLLDLNYGVLDCSIPFVARLGLIDKIIEYMTFNAESCNSYNHKMIMSSWGEMIDLINSPKYAHWLVGLARSDTWLS